MKTVTETKKLYGTDWHSLDALIANLGEIRAQTNQNINVSVQGSLNFGYTIVCSWQRPMTEEEEKREEEMNEDAEKYAKQLRREQYEKLKAEFESEENGVR